MKPKLMMVSLYLFVFVSTLAFNNSSGIYPSSIFMESNPIYLQPLFDLAKQAKLFDSFLMRDFPFL